MPRALVIVPDGEGRYVTAELRNVRFEDAGQDAECVLGKFELEDRGTALKRLIRWATRRTMHDHSGWHSAYRLRGA